MSGTSKIILAIVVIAILIGGYYLLRGRYGNLYGVLTPTSTPAGSPSQTIDVTGTNFRFSPDTINVKSGEIVKINFTNNGSTSHSFVIRDLNIGTKTISPGQTDSIVFTAQATGDYAFYCSVDGHEELGMRGTLKIE